MLKISLISGIGLLSSCNLAFADWGHVGELAGHSHWLGLGAVVVAGALAGLVGIMAEDEETEDAEPEIDADLPEGEAV